MSVNKFWIFSVGKLYKNCFADNRMFQVLEKINKKVSELNSKVDCLTDKVDKITSSSTNLPPAFDYLPEDVSLPVTTLEELDQLNDKLKKDKEFSAIVVKLKKKKLMHQ